MNGKNPGGEIWDEVQHFITTGTLFDTDGFVDIRGLHEEMVTNTVVERARKSIKIQARYDNQDYQRVGGRGENMRKNWTPKQKRRMNKKLKKIGAPRV